MSLQTSFFAGLTLKFALFYGMKAKARERKMLLIKRLFLTSEFCSLSEMRKQSLTRILQPSAERSDSGQLLMHYLQMLHRFTRKGGLDEFRTHAQWNFNISLLLT